MPLDFSKGIFILHTFVNMRGLLFAFFVFLSLNQAFAQIELPDEIIETSTSTDNVKREGSSLNVVNESLNIETLYPEKMETLAQNDSFLPSIFSKLSWDAFKEAISCSNRNYYLDFTASWCKPCKMMEKEVFNDQEVSQITHQYYFAKQIDIDDFDGIAVAQKYNITSIPTILIFDCNSKLLRRLEGFQYADMFVNQLIIHK